MKFEQLESANKNIKTTPIKGKDYAEVNQRIKVFRMLFPNGAIVTDLLSDENGICKFKATVYDEEGKILATGHAYEKESSSFINKTSYIENCETSAVGRALGMIGIGIDVSVASYEEVANAINNQNKKEETKPEEPTVNENAPQLINEKEIAWINKRIKEESLAPNKILQCYKLTKFEDMTVAQYTSALGILDKYKEARIKKEEQNG